MELSAIDPNEKPLDYLPPDGGYTAIFRKIVCVGDSLSSGEFESRSADGSKGYHDMFEFSWGQFIARMCGSEVRNFSRGGMTAKEYCESFAEQKDFWNPQYAAQAYIIALGINDLLGQKQEVGSIADVDWADWRYNNPTFAGYYAQIVQRLKEIQPRAKFFLMTFTRTEDDLPEEHIDMRHRRFLYELAGATDNTYVLDLLKYSPKYDEEFRRRYYLNGHLNPMGYLFTAKMTAAYIDYIIRHNMEDFREVGFIGTDLHG